MSLQHDVTASALSPSQDLDALWMPFTSNRRFKADPLLFEKAQGTRYQAVDGRLILDGTAGLWCVNAGHGRTEIADAIHRQALTLDFASTFQVGHVGAFSLAARLRKMLPGDLDYIFFTNSGSEAVESALKIALAWHRLGGEGGRTRLVGRARGYHGVGLGGTAVGGIGRNRKAFGVLVPGVDHLPHTYDRESQRYCRGQPDWCVDRAEALSDLIELHDASTIAAVIVEPVATSVGVYAPPRGYLQRLREICTEHGILLIFDEVVSGFGRLGSLFGATHFDVQPDLLLSAKGVTNGVVPLGFVAVRRGIYERFMAASDEGIELFHGFTYSGHPVATAAAHAALDIYENEGLFQRAAQIADLWADAVHSLRDLESVLDVRTIGLMAGIDLVSPGDASTIAGRVARRCFEDGLLVRAIGNSITLSPAFTISPEEIEKAVEIVRRSIECIRIS